MPKAKATPRRIRQEPEQEPTDAANDRSSLASGGPAVGNRYSPRVRVPSPAVDKPHHEFKPHYSKRLLRHDGRRVDEPFPGGAKLRLIREIVQLDLTIGDIDRIWRFATALRAGKTDGQLF